jgi:hypothetical protein
MLIDLRRSISDLRAPVSSIGRVVGLGLLGLKLFHHVLPTVDKYTRFLKGLRVEELSFEG